MLGKPDLRFERPDLRFERPDLRLGRPDWRSERSILGPKWSDGEGD